MINGAPGGFEPRPIEKNFAGWYIPLRFGFTSYYVLSYVLSRRKRKDKQEGVASFFEAPVAQLDRASASEVEGRGFEPLRAHHV